MKVTAVLLLVRQRAPFASNAKIEKDNDREADAEEDEFHDAVN
jgi:hypothetical protein